MNDLKAKRIAILNKTKGNVPTRDEKKLRDIQDEDDQRTPDSKIPKQLRPHITKKREWKNKEAGFYTVMKTAGLVKEAAFGDSIRGALGMETDKDRARRAAMIGAAVPFAGSVGAAVGGGMEGGAGGAGGALLGSMAGGTAGLMGGALLGGGLGALALGKRGRRMAVDAAEDLYRQSRNVARNANLEDLMDPQDLAALRAGANATGTASAIGVGAVPAGLLGAYGGNIYGAGQGAEWGTE